MALCLALAWPDLAFAQSRECLSAATQIIQTAPPAQLNHRAQRYDFAILDKIDTAPEFALRPQANGAGRRGASKARSLVNFMLDTRGTDWSKEGADVVVGKKSDLSSETTQFYLDQIHRDDLHWQVVSSIARVAGAYSNALTADSSVGSFNENAALLQQLIGARETERTIKWLTEQAMDDQQGKPPKQKWLDLAQLLDCQEAMNRTAMEKDAVLETIKRELLPFANKGKNKRIATKLAYSALGIASFVPNWIAPIAETTFLSTMMANGGPEQDKLLKELYFAKRLEKRHDLIGKEVSLALSCHQISIETGNTALLHFSQDLTAYLCGSGMDGKLYPDESQPPGQLQEGGAGSGATAATASPL